MQRLRVFSYCFPTVFPEFTKPFVLFYLFIILLLFKKFEVLKILYIFYYLYILLKSSARL